MKPGYYVVVRDTVLSASAERASYRARLHKGDWLVTNGYVVGRFDKTEELDWMPLEWVRGAPVVLNEPVASDIALVAAPIPVSRLQAGFEKLVFVEPGEPVPDMPRPSLRQLSTYLRERRVLLAYDYDRG